MQFDDRVGLGTFNRWILEAGHSLRFWRCDLSRLPSGNTADPLLLLGGYMGVGDRNQLPYLQETADWLTGQAEKGRPILAICLGAQLLAYALGGSVHSQSRQEKGLTSIRLTDDGRNDPLLFGLTDPFLSFEWHNDSFDLPEGGLLLAATETCPAQVFRLHNSWGVQFHPEVDAHIVADWCQRTGSGDGPLNLFRQKQEEYFACARQLLGNYLEQAEKCLN